MFNGEGGEFEATVQTVDRRAVVLAVGAARGVERESPLAITLALGVSRSERMDYAVQKAVELGVARIVPVLTAHCVVRLDAERRVQRLEHWRKVVISACEQCGRNRLPAVEPIVRLGDWLGEAQGDLKLVLSPEGSAALAETGPPDQTAVVLVGPEGGLSETELQMAVQGGFRPLRLGPRILRTETAAMAAVSALQVLWGDLAKA